MRVVIATIAVMMLNTLSAQHSWVSNHDANGLSAGITEVDFSGLNQSLMQQGVQGFDNQIFMAGWDAVKTANISGTTASFDAMSSLSFMLRETRSNGTGPISYRMRGWQYVTSTFGKDVIPGDAIALVLAPGVVWGNTKLDRKVGNIETLYTNPVVAPMVRAELRIKLWRLVLGGRAFYRYDLTDAKWKRKDDLMPVLNGTRQHGLGMQVFLLWNKK
jgi:hypothetical protein